MTTVINEIVQGDDYPWRIVVTNGAGTGVNIAGWILQVNILTNITDDAPNAQVAWSYTFPDNADTQSGVGAFLFPHTETQKTIPGYAWLSMKMIMTTLSPVVRKTFMKPRRITIIENTAD